MTIDTARLRELAEAATLNDDPDDWPLEGAVGWDRPEDNQFVAAISPQTMIALLDELEQAKKSECTALCRDVEAERDALQARIDAALRIIREHSAYGVIPPTSLIEAALSTPTENGEGQ